MQEVVGRFAQCGCAAFHALRCDSYWAFASASFTSAAAACVMQLIPPLTPSVAQNATFSAEGYTAVTTAAADTGVNK